MPCRLDRKGSIWRKGLAAAGIAVLLVVLLFQVRQLLLTKLIEAVIGDATGFEPTFRGVRFNPFTGRLVVRHFRLNNPPAFPALSFLDIPDLVVDLKLSDLFLHKGVHLEQVRLHVREAVVVRASDGVTNLTRLRPLDPALTLPKTERVRGKGNKIFFQIDELYFALDAIQYVDFTVRGGQPRRTRFDAAAGDKVFRNVTDPRALLGVVVLEIAYKTAIENLGVDSQGLAYQLQGVLANSDELTNAGKKSAQAPLDPDEKIGLEGTGTGFSPARAAGETVRVDAAPAAQDFFGEAIPLAKDTPQDLRRLVKTPSKEQ